MTSMPAGATPCAEHRVADFYHTPGPLEWKPHGAFTIKMLHDMVFDGGHGAEHAALVLEKLMLGALPIPASILLTWAAVSAYGFDAAPFLLWAFTGGAIALVGVPLPSSFLQPVPHPTRPRGLLPPALRNG